MIDKKKEWKERLMESIEKNFKPGTEPKGIRTPPKPIIAPRQRDNAKVDEVHAEK